MKHLTTFGIALMLLTACSDGGPSKDGNAADAADNPASSTNAQMPYQPFPDGFGYMTDIPALQAATDKGDRDPIRRHAWGLWAGMMQPDASGRWPVWYTWPNTNAAFAAPTPGPAKAEAAKSSAKPSLTKARSLKQVNKIHVPVDTPAPIYPLPPQVRKAFPKVICPNADSPNDRWTDGICPTNTRFLFNGDILIPTESLSREAFDDLRNPARPLYEQSTLDQAHAAGVPMLKVTPDFIVTKHMYWPVKANGLSPIPVWTNDFPYSYTGYAGYEVWNKIVAVDPTGTRVGQTGTVSFLYGVLANGSTPKAPKPIPTKTVEAPIVGLDQFYSHRVTKDEWLNEFSEADRAVINAASYWSYNEPFGPGDYLVTVASHINTRELPSWTLQSAWWSDSPDKGPYAANRPDLPQAQGPWRHYLLTDSYAVPPNADGKLDVAVNPYIEGVIHPIGTSCRNCHVRAGWPTGSTPGTASYQNPDCPGLLSYLTPTSACFKHITLTDYLWIIPDRAVK
jgi:hypothetical protein